jgi:hypothetical protein
MSMFSEISLDYDFSSVLAADHLRHSDTCIYHQMRELSDIYDGFGGFPASFNHNNTTIHQLWWTPDDLDFADIGRQLGMEVVSISSILQEPGHVIPYHRDMFHKINERFPHRSERRVRANVFLEQGKLGHVLQFTVDQQHRTVTDWAANTGFMFDSDILHLSCNAGIEPKYTLQVSGLLLDQPQ